MIRMYKKVGFTPMPGEGETILMNLDRRDSTGGIDGEDAHSAGIALPSSRSAVIPEKMVNSDGNRLLPMLSGRNMHG